MRGGEAKGGWGGGGGEGFPANKAGEGGVGRGSKLRKACMRALNVYVRACALMGVFVRACARARRQLREALEGLEGALQEGGQLLVGDLLRHHLPARRAPRARRRRPAFGWRRGGVCGRGKGAKGGGGKTGRAARGNAGIMQQRSSRMRRLELRNAMLAVVREGGLTRTELRRRLRCRAGWGGPPRRIL